VRLLTSSIAMVLVHSSCGGDAVVVGQTTPIEDDFFAEPTGPTGFVFASQQVLLSAGGSGATFSADFRSAAPPRYARDCRRERAGDCFVVVCDYSGDEPTLAPLIDAGILTMRIAGQKPARLDPYQAGYGTVLFLRQPAWSPGETVVFEAAGGPVPAFSTTIVGPDNVVGPAVPPELGRDADLVLAWTGGDVGAFVYQMNFGSSARTGALACSFPVAQGRGVVPASLLAQVTPGPVTVSQAVRNGKALQVGDTRVTVALFSAVVLEGRTQLASGDAVMK
jgi:hypothetical protein